MTEQHRRELGHLAEDLRKLSAKYASRSTGAVQPSKKAVWANKAARYCRQREAVLAALDTPSEDDANLRAEFDRMYDMTADDRFRMDRYDERFHSFCLGVGLGRRVALDRPRAGR